MTSNNFKKRKVTHESIAQKKIELAKNKAETEEKRQIKLKEKSAFFRKTPGKILLGFNLLVILFCVIFLVDGQLDKSYTKFEIKSSSEDVVQLYKRGWMVNSTFNWVYLDKSEQFGIHMHKIEFAKINKDQSIDLGRSPLFKIPSNFRIKNQVELYDIVELYKENNYLIALPVILLFISILWLFSKPSKSFQWIMFGYINIVVTPLILSLLLIKVYDYLNEFGMYEIDISLLNI